MPAALGAFLLPSLAGTFTASLVGGAIIGAGVGALTAAVTGGNIFQGALFGAVGGAVLGGVSFGLDKAFTAMQLSTSGVGQSGMQGIAGKASTYGIGPAAGGIAETGSSSFLGSVGTFMKSQGGVAFGMQAVSSGIKGVADVYAQKREGESAEAMAERQHEMNKETMALQHKYNKELAGGRGGGGGGGASGPDYTIDELIRRDTSAAEQERQTVLAKVSSEIEGQRGLRQMDFAETAAARERASAAATALKGGPRTGSRSENTLVDTIEGAKGEGSEYPAAYVDVGVDYNPGGYVDPNDVHRTA